MIGTFLRARVWARGLSLWLVGCTMLLPTAAAHDQSRVHLAWHVPAASGCIEQPELERAVESLLGRAVFVAQARAHYDVRGSIELADGHWAASLTLATAQGTLLGRRLLSNAGDCSALTRTLIVVLATLVDAPERTATAPPTAARDTRGFAVGLTAGVVAGTLPHPMPEAEVSGAFEPARPWPSVRLSLGAGLPQSVRDSQGRGGRFQAFQASLLICPTLLQLEALRVDACAGAGFALLTGRGLELSPARAPDRLVASIPAELAISIPLFAHLSLRLSGGAFVALDRPRFYFHGADGAVRSVHQPSLFGAVLGLGFIADRL